MTVSPVPPAQPEPPAAPSMRSASETLQNGPAATGFPEQHPITGQAPGPHWVQQGPAAAMRTSKKPLFFGFGGLAVGLAAGLISGVLIAGSVAANDEAEAQASADASAVAEVQAIAAAIPAAVEKCSATSDKHIQVMDGGRSVSMSTTGKKSFGTSTTMVVCVLGEVDAPDSLYSKIESTRALDGTKSAEWPGFAASWTYHPDNGLNIIVETAAK